MNSVNFTGWSHGLLPQMPRRCKRGAATLRFRFAHRARGSMDPGCARPCAAHRAGKRLLWPIRVQREAEQLRTHRSRRLGTPLFWGKSPLEHEDLLGSSPELPDSCLADRAYIYIYIYIYMYIYIYCFFLFCAPHLELSARPDQSQPPWPPGRCSLGTASNVDWVFRDVVFQGVGFRTSSLNPLTHISFRCEFPTPSVV